MTEYGVFNDEGCVYVADTKAEAEAQADVYRAEDDGYWAELYSVREMCSDHRDAEQPKDGCKECAAEENADDESTEDDDEAEDEEPADDAATPEFNPVGFDDVREGDTVRFVTANNGFGGGDDVWRTGAVVKVTDKTVTVEIVGPNPLAENVFVGGKSRKLGRTASLRRAEWQRRCVSKAVTEKPARRPYNAENVQTVDDGRIITAVWVSDPSVEPSVALENILRRDLPYEVEVIAEATRFYKREGADFSGWVVSGNGGYSDGIPNKRDAVRNLRYTIREHFAR